MVWVYMLATMAAFFNACMDAFENTPNFDESIFRNWDKRFWCKDVSCRYVKVILGYRPDAWHICKSIMWSCVIAAVIVAWFLPRPQESWLIHFCGLSIAPIIMFPVFYHGLFRIK